MVLSNAFYPHDFEMDTINKEIFKFLAFNLPSE